MQTKSWLPQGKDTQKSLFSGKLSRAKVYLKTRDHFSCSATADKDVAEGCALEKAGLSLDSMLVVGLYKLLQCYGRS